MLTAAAHEAERHEGQREQPKHARCRDRRTAGRGGGRSGRFTRCRADIVGTRDALIPNEEIAQRDFASVGVEEQRQGARAAFAFGNTAAIRARTAIAGLEAHIDRTDLVGEARITTLTIGHERILVSPIHSRAGNIRVDIEGEAGDVRRKTAAGRIVDRVAKLICVARHAIEREGQRAGQIVDCVRAIINEAVQVDREGRPDVSSP